MTNLRTLFPLVFLVLTSTVGCRTIRNTATVEIPMVESAQDQTLSRSVLGRLLADKKADLTGVSVVSNNGKVYLSGTVKSLDAREHALKIAWQSPGVQSVVNSLRVHE